MIAKVDIETIELDYDQIRLTEYDTLDDFITKVKDRCTSVVGQLSILRQRTKNDFDYIELDDIETQLNEILNYIEKL